MVFSGVVNSTNFFSPRALETFLQKRSWSIRTLSSCIQKCTLQYSLHAYFHHRINNSPLVPGGCQQLVSLIANRCMVFLSALLTTYSTPALSCMKSWPSAIKAHPLLRYHPFPLVYRGYARAIARDVTRVISVNTTTFVHGFCVEKTRFAPRALCFRSYFLQSLGLRLSISSELGPNGVNPSLASFLVPWPNRLWFLSTYLARLLSFRLLSQFFQAFPVTGC